MIKVEKKENEVLILFDAYDIRIHKSGINITKENWTTPLAFNYKCEWNDEELIMISRSMYGAEIKLTMLLSLPDISIFEFILKNSNQEARIINAYNEHEVETIEEKVFKISDNLSLRPKVEIEYAILDIVRSIQPIIVRCPKGGDSCDFNVDEMHDTLANVHESMKQLTLNEEQAKSMNKLINLMKKVGTIKKGISHDKEIN